MNDLAKPAPTADRPVTNLTNPVPAPAPSLADRINAAHGEVQASLVRGAEKAMAVGQMLWEAKAKYGRHGRWLDWIGENCKFSERTAQLYMKLADDAKLMGANPQSIADLSTTDAIKMLEDLKNPPEPPIVSPTGRGSRGKKDRVAEAIKTDPLAILEKAWDAAKDNERLIFKTRIENEPPPRRGI